MGVHLRADLTGHDHPSPFCQNEWDGRRLLDALLDQLWKGHLCRILILFPSCSTPLLAPNILLWHICYTSAKCVLKLFSQCPIIGQDNVKMYLCAPSKDLENGDTSTMAVQNLDRGQCSCKRILISSLGDGQNIQRGE